MTARANRPEDDAEPEHPAGPAEEGQQSDDASEDASAGRIEPEGDVDTWPDRLRRDESLSEASPEASLPPHTE